MKIESAATIQTEDLLERLREAADVGQTERATATGPAAEAAQAGGPGEVAAMRDIAARALSGEFADAAALRTEVVGELLRLRWHERVSGPELAKMLDDLTPTLVADPTFVQQVDQMLLVAARELHRP